MNQSITIIEEYLRTLDQDINSLLATKDFNNTKEVDDTLVFLEQAESKLFFILEALKTSMQKLKSIK